MKKKLFYYVIAIAGLIISTQLTKLLFASSCHGGHGGGSRQQEIKQKKHTGKTRHPAKITKIIAPSKMNIKGKMTCAGSFLFKKGYHDIEKKCRNTSIMVKKVKECDKSGTEDCPYENKLFHILLNDKNKKLLQSKKYQNEYVTVKGRFYTEERILEVLEFGISAEDN